MPALRCCGAAAPFSQRSLRKSVGASRERIDNLLSVRIVLVLVLVVVLGTVRIAERGGGRERRRERTTAQPPLSRSEVCEEAYALTVRTSRKNSRGRLSWTSSPERGLPAPRGVTAGPRHRGAGSPRSVGGYFATRYLAKTRRFPSRCVNWNLGKVTRPRRSVVTCTDWMVLPAVSMFTAVQVSPGINLKAWQRRGTRGASFVLSCLGWRLTPPARPIARERAGARRADCRPCTRIHGTRTSRVWERNRAGGR